MLLELVSELPKELMHTVLLAFTGSVGQLLAAAPQCLHRAIVQAMLPASRVGAPVQWELQAEDLLAERHTQLLSAALADLRIDAFRVNGFTPAFQEALADLQTLHSDSEPALSADAQVLQLLAQGMSCMQLPESVKEFSVSGVPLGKLVVR